MKVVLKTFESLKPYYVRQLRGCNTSTYRYHVKIIELKAKCNNMKSKHKNIHQNECSYMFVMCFGINLKSLLGFGHSFVLD